MSKVMAGGEGDLGEDGSSLSPTSAADASQDQGMGWALGPWWDNLSSPLMGITSPFSPLPFFSFHRTEFFILAEFSAVGHHSHRKHICFTILLKQAHMVNREKVMETLFP